MTLASLRIVFMATPDFALPALELLHLSRHRLIAVVTRPDRPSGRGRRSAIGPVKEWALRQGLPLAQPHHPDDPAFLAWLGELAPDLICTAAYGGILPHTILRLPALGCINLHASCLPAYRGAAPINRAIIEGAAYSGVSVLQMTSALDAGPCYAREEEPISPYDTAGMLHDRLALRGAELLAGTVHALAEGKAVKTAQDEARATYAPALTPEDELLNWQEDALALYNRIRGLNPRPGAYTYYGGKRIKIWQAARPRPAEECLELPGTILAVGDEALRVAAGKGCLDLLHLQPSGKRQMPAASFCCGYRVEPGHRLGPGPAP